MYILLGDDGKERDDGTNIVSFTVDVFVCFQDMVIFKNSTS